MPVTIRQPHSDEEFEQYYRLRYRLLREPWGEPEGSEKDDIEDECFHIAAFNGELIVGVGRVQFNGGEEAQIRYMAVEPGYERRGIGRRIVEELEQHALNNDVSGMVLDAREPAVGFYEKLGYDVTGKSHLLFSCIQHYRMRKRIA